MTLKKNIMYKSQKHVNPFVSFAKVINDMIKQKWVCVQFSIYKGQGCTCQQHPLVVIPLIGYVYCMLESLEVACKMYVPIHM